MSESSDKQREFFDKKPNRYPHAVNPPFAQRLEMEHLTRALGKIPGKNILDFGAGSGRVTFWFLKKGYNVTAVDISPKSLARLSKEYTLYRTSSWGTLTTATSLPKKTFDAIVGADILHHVDMNAYLPKLYRLVKPCGRIAFSEPNAWFLPWYAYIFFRKLPWSVERGVLQMTIQNIAINLRRAGFSNITIAGFPFFRKLAFRLIVSAQKRKRPHRLGKRSHP